MTFRSKCPQCASNDTHVKPVTGGVIGDDGQTHLFTCPSCGYEEIVGIDRDGSRMELLGVDEDGIPYWTRKS